MVSRHHHPAERSIQIDQGLSYTGIGCNPKAYNSHWSPQEGIIAQGRTPIIRYFEIWVRDRFPSPSGRTCREGESIIYHNLLRVAKTADGN